MKVRMIMTSIHLNGHHRKTLASVFRHPTSHNVEWHDVLSLLNTIGSASERHGGGYDVAIGDAHLALGRPHGKDLSGDELRHLRAFLTEAGLTEAGLSAASLTSEELAQAAVDRADGQCIVLIDHQQARLFGLGGADADPAVPRLVTPEDPDGTRGRIEHKQGNADHDGGHAGEDDTYYARISAELAPARQIVVFSDGKGRSSAGAYLIAYLQRHHPAIADRIVANERVDIAHLSNAEIVTAGLALLAPV